MKYFTKDLLIKANNEAIRSKRNRSLKPKSIKALPDDLKFPVTFEMPHNDREMRLQIVLDNNGTNAWIDVPFKTYNKIPVTERVRT